jgi:hypothetical protein
MVGSSILPVSLHKGQLYFLFGKENELETSARGFSDFGGGMEAGETALDTAYREGGEEMTGFLGDIRTLAQKNGGLLALGDPTAYNIHILCIPFDENLPTYYNNNHQFLWDRMNHQILSKTKLFEKIEIKWFSVAEIRRRIKEFRPFYRDILKKHILSPNTLAKIHTHCRARRRRRRNKTHRKRTTNPRRTHRRRAPHRN